MTYIARSWAGKNAINSFLRKLLAEKKSAFRKRVWSSAHRLSILAYRYDIEIINFTVNRSTPYRWHPYQPADYLMYHLILDSIMWLITNYLRGVSHLGWIFWLYIMLLGVQNNPSLKVAICFFLWCNIKRGIAKTIKKVLNLIEKVSFIEMS